MMTRRTSLTLGGAAAVVAAAAGTVIALPNSALGRGESDVMPLASAPIDPTLKSGIVQAARDVGASTSDLVEVAAAGQPATRAGLVLGHDGAGEFVAHFGPRIFTNFVPPSEFAMHRTILAYASAQPDTPGGAPAHVQLSGIATPSVKTASISLADGSTVTVELIRAGKSGFSYFTYASDDPSTFPRSLSGFDGGDALVGTQDLSADIAAP
jgi:hypothetical protein